MAEVTGEMRAQPTHWFLRVDIAEKPAGGGVVVDAG
jgi:hypothetical protein